MKMIKNLWARYVLWEDENRVLANTISDVIAVVCILITLIIISY